MQEKREKIETERGGKRKNVAKEHKIEGMKESEIVSLSY